MIGIMLVAILAGRVSATVVWSADFESATVGAVNAGSNDNLPGTSIYAKNAAAGFLEVVATPGEFTGNMSANVVKITATDNNFEAITPGENGINVDLGESFVAADNNYTFSFDFYLLNDSPTLNLGEVQYRWKNSGSGANFEDPNDSAITVAGVYHIEYTGLLSSVTDQTEVNQMAHFVRIWEDSFAGEEVGVAELGDVIGYMDNLELDISPIPEPATVGMLGLGALMMLSVRRIFRNYRV